jgi:hypothetical protein
VPPSSRAQKVLSAFNSAASKTTTWWSIFIAPFSPLVALLMLQGACPLRGWHHSVASGVGERVVDGYALRVGRHGLACSGPVSLLLLDRSNAARSTRVRITHQVPIGQPGRYETFKQPQTTV